MPDKQKEQIASRKQTVLSIIFFLLLLLGIAAIFFLIDNFLGFTS